MGRLALTLAAVLSLLGARVYPLVFVGFAAVNAWLLVPLFTAADRATVAGPTVRVLLQNVNRHTGDPVRVLELLASEAAEIVILQEVTERWRDAMRPLLPEEFEGRKGDVLPDSWGYSDSVTDVPLLVICENGVMIHPGSKLAGIGAGKGWETRAPVRPYSGKWGGRIASALQACGFYRVPAASDGGP